MRHGNLFWGVVLLLLGGMMFLDAANVRLFGGIRATELFWPVILLVAGAWMIFGVFLRGAAQAEQASIDLQGAREARVRLSHGAGRLQVRGASLGGELARGTFGGGLRQSAQKTGDHLEVKMRTAAEIWIPFGPGVRYDWDVEFNMNVPMKLSMETGADESDVDLSGLQLTDFKLETGASNTTVTLPARGRLHADFDLGAASLTVIVPAGVAARIRVDSGVSDVKIDSRFLRVGGVYQSPDYETAANAVDMDIDAGAAQITVR
ncbi:MAG: hypothetical protein AB1564_14745 [Chloroflexota bacterium]